MGDMNKLAGAATALAVAVALTGCASQSIAAKHTPDDRRSTFVANPGADMMLNAIQKGWVGDDAPDAEWFDTAALLVCKQIIGGIEPRVTDNPANNELVVSTAEWGVCEIDR